MSIFISKLSQLSRSQRNRNLLYQFLFLILVAFFVNYFISKAMQLELTLSHFESRSGFGISHTFLKDYTSNDSRWSAYFTGVINTIRVSLVAIILATLLGTVMGVARLSKNVLFSTISYLYVEILRNTPLLIQIIFWQIIFLKLPRITEALTLGSTVVISNRGILLPSTKANQDMNSNIFIFILLFIIIISFGITYYLNKREDLDGKKLKILNLVKRNAKEGYNQFRIKQNAKISEEKRTLSELQEDLNLISPPNRIECFDISHIQGTNTVGSMVVFENGKPKKSHYRKFKIKSHDNNDDFASMYEVVKRRCNYFSAPRWSTTLVHDASRRRRQLTG